MVGRNRPVLYAVLLIAVLAATYLFELRRNGVFACASTGYTADSYLAYCNSTAYGDYDHGALWFNFEPEVLRFAGAAEVLFLGSSRMEFAFSTPATTDWAAANRLSYYLFGFAYTENIRFVAPLLKRVTPRATAYVINADGFFYDHETAPVADIFHDDAVESRYRRKRIWQTPHRLVCNTVSSFCGDSLAFFRTRATGTWTFGGTDALVRGAVADAPIKDRRDLERRIGLAEAFVSSLPASRSCVFLTVAPWAATPRADTAAIAEALGVRMVAPSGEGLHTFDGSHLDAPSAAMWSREFFAIAGADIAECARGAGRGEDVSGSLVAPRAAP